MDTHIDLFSGLGGNSFAMDKVFNGVEHIFCEIDPFCQKVLKKNWPHSKIYEDIRTFHYDKPVRFLTGGFPCQPFSNAGKRKGKDDDRDLWPEMFRVIKETKPTWVIGENVAGFVRMELDRSLADLESEGYEVRAFVLPACAVGAPHRRDRVWIVAHSDSKHGTDGKNEDDTEQRLEPPLTQSDPRNQAPTSNTINERRQRSIDNAVERKRGIARQSTGSASFWADGWPVSASRLCGVDDGIPQRTQRLKALGNSIVPQVVEEIFKAIKVIDESL